MHGDRVDSWLFVVGSQIPSLTLGLSFCHNLCCKCLDGSCEPILKICTSIIFQWYKEFSNVRCFDPYNHLLKVWESRWTPKLPFQECEFSPSHSLNTRVATTLKIKSLWTSTFFAIGNLIKVGQKQDDKSNHWTIFFTTIVL
jgi:hypothetical protein